MTNPTPTPGKGKEIKWLHSKIHFKVGKQKYSFNVAHNLPEMGLSIDAAFINWSVRTDDFSIQSFCEYVKSKDPMNIVCVPKIEFDKYK